MQYTQMREALKEAGASKAKGKPMKALMKNRQKSERIKLAKLEVSEETRQSIAVHG